MCARAELTSGLELPTFRKGRAEQYTTIKHYRIVSREQYTDSEYT